MFFRLLSLLAAFGILVLFGGPAASLVTSLFTDKAGVQTTDADGTARHAVRGPNAPYPAWLLLPADAPITDGAVFDADPVQGGLGEVKIAVGDDGQALFAAWEQRLRAAGLIVVRRADPTDRLLDIEAGLVAEQPAAGRRLQLLLRRIDGTRLLQLSYWEAPRRPGK